MLHAKWDRIECVYEMKLLFRAMYYLRIYSMYAYVATGVCSRYFVTGADLPITVRRIPLIIIIQACQPLALHTQLHKH